jgi:hypothetical protein
MMKWMSKLRSKKGAVLTEVAFVSMILMVMVVAMASVAVRMSSVENMGRAVKEVTDVAVQMIIDEDEITHTSEDILLDMVARRTKTDPSEVYLEVIHVSRNAFSGNYDIVARHVMGDLDRDTLIDVRSAPQSNPGVALLGESVTLDYGQELLVVQMATVYDGAVGFGGSQTNELVSFSFVP